MPSGLYERQKHELVCKECDNKFYVTHIKQSRGYCKKCSKIISDREYGERNREKINQAQRDYVKNNKDLVRASERKYWENNKPKMKDRMRKYYLTNRESILKRAEKRRRERGEKKRGLSGTEAIALEILKDIFPGVEIREQDRTTVRNPKTNNFLELDFYLPSLNLAIELNGVTHYKPIYGEEKFKRQKKNDLIKDLQCRKQGIHLIKIRLDNGVHFDRYDTEHKKLRKKIEDEIESFPPVER